MSHQPKPTKQNQPPVKTMLGLASHAIVDDSAFFQPPSTQTPTQQPVQPPINSNPLRWLALVHLFLSIAFATLYFTAEADNQYLESRYHQCSGKYI